MASIKVCDPIKVPVDFLHDLQDLCRDLEQARAELAQARAEIDRLRAELAQAKGALDESRRASKRQAAPFSKGPPRPNPKKPGRKAGAAHGRHGHRPAPPPDRIDETYDAPLPAACSCCGGAVRETSVAAQYQAEIPRRPIIRRFNVHVGRCRDCGKRVQGRHPLQTSDALGAAASQVGPDAQAAVATLNKTFGLSHVKVVAVFEALFGIKLTRGACVQMVLRAAGRLGAAHQEIRKETKASPRLTPDETGWRVGGKAAWLHAWVSPRATCYAVAGDRSVDSLVEAIGGDWPGAMTHDGFSSYGRFAKATHQQCLGHVLRRARELLKGATRGAVHYPRKLIALLTEAIHLRNRHLKGEVSAGQLKAARAGFDRRMRELAWPAREVPAYETLSNHLWAHLKEWFAFLDDPQVEPTNWEAEQAIRPAVVNRKVWGGNRTWSGARAQEVLTSVLVTCGRAGRSGLEFVSETLRALGNTSLPRPVLLPSR